MTTNQKTTIPEELRKTIKSHSIETNRKPIIFLFDVDGTLTPSRLPIEDNIKSLLKEIKNKVYIGFVGGSNYEKQNEQLGKIIEIFDYAFPENGLCFYRNNVLVNKIYLIEEMGEDLYKQLINRTLALLSEIDIPIKRGTFIEYRDSILNISPIGRNCSQKERMEFLEFDKKHQIRQNLVDILKKEFGKYNIHFSIGGQISIDVFPVGWDKRFCLNFLEDFEKIYFFGDMVHEGGNDFEIFFDERTIGVSVANPEEAEQKIKEIMKKNQ
ncbi:Phosphomannomutase [Cucumispora dikerogammari]|nr:Phosphomannomutase [Cucumispora dikerogammari]